MQGQDAGGVPLRTRRLLQRFCWIREPLFGGATPHSVAAQLCADVGYAVAERRAPFSYREGDLVHSPQDRNTSTSSRQLPHSPLHRHPSRPDPCGRCARWWPRSRHAYAFWRAIRQSLLALTDLRSGSSRAASSSATCAGATRPSLVEADRRPSGMVRWSRFHRGPGLGLVLRDARHRSLSFRMGWRSSELREKATRRTRRMRRRRPRWAARARVSGSRRLWRGSRPGPLLGSLRGTSGLPWRIGPTVSCTG